MTARHPAPPRATLLVIAKEPVPGRVKTRLTPPYTPREAATLAEAALADTLHTVLEAPARRRVLVLDGAPGRWLPPGFDVVPQEDGGLDERIAAAFGHCDRGPALLIGMDTPQLTARLLAETAGAGHDAWFGPAEDGGFWALGLADPGLAAALVRGVPMSTERTGAALRRRLVEAGLTVRDLPVLRDVDTAADAAAVAACCAPGSRFATALHSLSGERR
ncbi:TIGR04282 family arsenosugar biosynthesis glycosyltransferase [Actinacidiphila sp. bgisy167]|uniref:TIGR04282 family arsenosugar biosynthesis glycosyltransferase n=1 Tax=Actinacidiphila sp. bgisy167 TaxID=3413797 RepID=UPI003D712FB4